MRVAHEGVMARFTKEEYEKLKYLAQMFETTEKKTVVQCVLIAYDVYQHALNTEVKHEDEGRPETDKENS